MIDGLNLFDIDAAGLIHVKRALNHEDEGAHFVKVRVSDDGKGFASGSAFSDGIVNVNVIDGIDPPVVTPGQRFSIPELGQAKDVPFATVAMTDDDPSPTGYTWSIVGGTGIFAINPSNGQLSLSDPSRINYEVKSSYPLLVRCTETGTAIFGEELVTILITDVPEAPYFDFPSYHFFVAEGTDIGTIVASVTARDEDIGTILTYSATHALFAVSSAGNISVKATLDSETNRDDVTFDVTASDGTTTTPARAKIVMTITDINEAPIVKDQTISVLENLPTGTDVFDLSKVCSDPEGDILTYVLVAGNDNGALKVDSATGHVQVYLPVFDYEASTQQIFTFAVVDVWGLTSTMTLTVNIQNANDPPVMLKLEPFTLIESSPVGTIVLDLNAITRDDENESSPDSANEFHHRRRCPCCASLHTQSQHGEASDGLPRRRSHATKNATTSDRSSPSIRPSTRSLLLRWLGLLQSWAMGHLTRQPRDARGAINYEKQRLTTSASRQRCKISARYLDQSTTRTTPSPSPSRTSSAPSRSTPPTATPCAR